MKLSPDYTLSTSIKSIPESNRCFMTIAGTIKYLSISRLSALNDDIDKLIKEAVRDQTEYNKRHINTQPINTTKA